MVKDIIFRYVNIEEDLMRHTAASYGSQPYKNAAKAA